MHELFQNIFKDLRWKDNIYKALVLYLLLVLALYSVCRIGFYFFNIDYFPDMTILRFLKIFFGGIRFDLSAILFTNLVFIVLLLLPFQFRFAPTFKKLIKYIFFLTNGLALAAAVADFIYFRFSLRRTTIVVLDQFQNENNWWSLVFHFLIDYWFAVAFWLVLMAILGFFQNRIKFEGPQLKNSRAFYFAGILMMGLGGVLWIGGVRGGFSGKPPISPINAAEYAILPKDINLVLNTPFVLLKTDPANSIRKVDYFKTEESLRNAFDPVKIPGEKGKFRAQNVVVIVLESFSMEFSGAYNPNPNEKSYTPFLDSLIRHSRAYRYSMANGIQSIDAMPSVICSIPRLEVPYLLSPYSGNKVNSLASLLREKGYYAAYFHGGTNGSMGFQAFANLCGFESYFGKDEYNHNEDYDDIWGIWDEPFLQFFAKKMDSFKPPFFTTVHTVSSHHPFKIPSEYSGRFKGGTLPIHQTIEYTDYSLRRFFETASKMPWFKNTLFVFTADHAASYGYFRIPIFFYEPSREISDFRFQITEAPIEDKIIEQIDIMPTVLGYLNYDQPYVSFGNDIFNTDTEPFAVTCLDNVYQAYQGDYMLIFDGTTSTGLYEFKIDGGMHSNLINRTEVVNKIETRLKGLIQQYNQRMVEDRLTVDSVIR